ncbi:hypothetical protein DXG01_016952 [Tephrocybe rancida]|nr:hypothetical protein DXG01_016952 [Tephrocybe rancida]
MSWLSSDSVMPPQDSSPQLNTKPFILNSATLRSDSELESNRAANQLRPIYSLPSDLLVRIFRVGQDLQWEDTEFDDASDATELAIYQSFEILVTHVSSHFRDVAMTSPLLWSSILLTPHISMAEMGAYLARSEGCWLSVRIETSIPFYISPLIMAQIDAIVPYSQRYRQLVINSVESGVHSLIQRFSDIPMPELKHLSVSIQLEGGFAGPPHPRMFIGNGAPHLTFVRLRGVALSLICTPLDDIQTLHLDQTVMTPINYSTFRKMVTSSSTLRNLSIYGDLIGYTATHWPGLNDPIHIPTLRCLRICGVSGDVYSGLLLGIIAPSLASIVLKDIRQRDIQPYLAVPFISLKFPLLRELILIDPDLTVDIYAELFDILPTITSFAIYDRGTSAVLQLLSSPNFGNVPWPELQTLSLLVDEDNIHTVVEVVEQRIAIGFPLDRLRLGTWDPIAMLPGFDWLNNNVQTVETFVSFDRWPEAEAMDPDDTLFQ